MNRIFETPLYPYTRSADQDALSAPHHRVVVVGAGPVGLAAAIDLALQGVEVLVLDENDKVSFGSRAICFAKRPLEILDRLGAGQRMVDKGVVWNLGRVFFRDREVYSFNLLPESGHRRPAFINLQQYYFEKFLVDRLREIEAEGAPIELRGMNRVEAVGLHPDHVHLEITTPEGPYELTCDWLIACDGARSPIRGMLGLDFVGKVFEDNFLIADVVMEADFPTERWFWFDPPFNPGQSALLHKQPDNVWRIDFQLGWNIDRKEELKPENIDRRLRAMLGEDIRYELEWSSIYTFQCRRMEKFRHGRVIFAGDSAHQVSPFGARGANSGLQDADNLCWKLRLVIEGKAPESLLDSYDVERIQAADENILNSTRSTEFITPKSEISRIFRDAVLDLSEHHEFARPLVNSGRLSVPAVHDGSPLNGPDALFGAPARTRPGAPATDAPLGQGFLLDRLGNRFVLLALGTEAPERLEEQGIIAEGLTVAPSQIGKELRERYLGEAPSAVYLIRPDQHVVARWPAFDETATRAALNRATARS
ncbi:3-(3-hydroxy-phenyl)propionate hydroxylase [Meinhardsimonia xiamenensis]|jgi:3-(3-hydroxy-phenyl)propionate hydroxylase|uniref:3-(3-hydroxy-phenyl)propionate hydroxylase n=1 Tax=Meinhardsimonia xiamenensis TaxID=990712 RepID=A0A1G9ACW3_9RHOB|nr:FAD-dependent oxidoreductase [Meinhardsimonia xiamenensis]PRX35468.1 3-(3-hydroxy-phenyl)propionate hydroxylase [Meinhardsimonia xiamenensis]SDK24380.1 3-(3-hydroxy-phenyl)propionate hydroxylase [Meinhardsimonia xiamenensis]